MMNVNDLSFPVQDPLGLVEIENTHNLLQIVPFEQNSLAYSLIMPKTWVMEKDLGEQPAGLGAMTKIGLFAEKVDPDAGVVQVYVNRMPLEIRLHDWIEFKADEFATQLVSIKDYRFACGPVVDAGGLYGPESNQHVVRIIGHIDDARIFLVVAMVRSNRYSQMQRDIAIATNSFKLLNPTGSQQMEQWLEFNMDGEAGFNVAYPATWTSREVNESLVGKNAVDIVLETEQRLLAYLRIKSIDSQIVGKFIADEQQHTTIEELAQANVRVVSSWRPEPKSSLSNWADVMEAYLAEGELNGIPIELRLGLVRRPPLDFAITLISVLRGDDRMTWMRAKRAYEIALITSTPN